MVNLIKNLFSIAVFICLFNSCETIQVPFEPENKDSNLFVFGKLIVDNYATIYVTKTVTATSQVSVDKQLIRDASVMLYKDNKVVDVMRYDSLSKSYLSNIKIEASQNYYVKINAKNFLPVESEVIRTTGVLNLDNIKTDEAACNEPKLCGGISNPNALIITYFLNLTFDKNQIKEDESFFSELPTSNVPELFLENTDQACYLHKSNRTLKHYNGKIFRGEYILKKSCISENTLKVRATSIRFKFDNIVSKGSILMSINSKEFAQYYESRTLPNAYIDGFVEPKETFSNIKGGYGVIYGTSERLIEF